MNGVKDPTDPHTIVLQAELSAGPAERVRAWLELRAMRSNSATLYLDQEAIERALLEREDPFVDLSLAKYAASRETVCALFARQDQQAKPLRLAVLMNEVVGRDCLFGLPMALVEPGNSANDLIAQFDCGEIIALFSNPKIDGGFLRSFLEQKEPWSSLDECRRLAAIAALSRNSRMTEAYDGPMDGHAEYSHDSVFDAAWALASKAPTTLQWATHLSALYQNTEPNSFSMKDPLQVAARWVPDPAEADNVEHEQQSLERGHLGPYAEIRKQIMKLSVCKAHSKEGRNALATHEDPAVRAAFYATAKLNIEEMRAADSRDFWLAFGEMMWNASVWRTKDHRQQLHDMAWNPKRDPENYLDPQNIYNARLEFYQKKYPSWFKDTRMIKPQRLRPYAKKAWLSIIDSFSKYTRASAGYSRERLG